MQTSFFARHRPACSLFTALFLSALLGACGGGSNASNTAGAGGAGTDSTPAVSSGSVSAALSSLSGTATYTLLFSGTEFGTDLRDVTATFNADNAMKSYHASADEALELGTGSVASRAGDADVNLGRWNGGTLAGKYYTTSPLPTLGGQQGFHYALAVKPTAPRCNGTISYVLTAATQPTQGDGSVVPGTLDSLSVTVSFGATSATTPVIQTTGGYTLGGSTVSLANTGSTAFGYGGNMKMGYSSAGTSPSEAVYLALGGAQADRLAFVYHRFTGTGGSASSISVAAYLSSTANSTSACP
jgi:hypothetical protein